MPCQPEIKKPDRVTPCKEHPRYRAGCLRCRAYGRYIFQRGAWRAAVGITIEMVPVSAVHDHVVQLTKMMPVLAIAAKSGVSEKRIRVALENVPGLSMTREVADAILGVPVPRHRIPKNGLVPNTEFIRTIQGLQAQGWTQSHIGDLFGGVSAKRVSNMARPSSTGVRRSTLSRVRAVARELKPYDIDLLDEPMPGMDQRARTTAAKKGWPKLWQWDGLDITDPDVTPPATSHTSADEDEADDIAGPLSVLDIDPVKMARVRATAQKIILNRITTNDRPPTPYVLPIGNLNHFEAHIVVDYAATLGMTDTETARLLGYPCTTRTEIESGQRTVCRFTANIREARAQVNSLTPDATPEWITAMGCRGRPIIKHVIAPLLALYPKPIGGGLTLTELAALCGPPEEGQEFLLREEQVLTHVRRCARYASIAWSPWKKRTNRRTNRRTGRKRRTGAALAAA